MKNSRKLLLTSFCGLAAVGIYACGSTGEQGEPGAAGAKGDGCSVVTNADGTATIKCTDGSSFNIVNGKDANPGDAGSDGKDGQDGKSCYLTENADGSAAVVCPYDGSSYIVRGNTDNYANYCKEGYYGPNCVDCSKNGKNSYFDRKECTFTDSRDGQIYNVVKIGDQIWMAENLKVQLDVSGNEVKCYANTKGDQYFVEKYGCLYTWDDAMKVCPAGWKLPEQKDFKQLLTATGADSDSSSIRASSWANGSDSSGFGALPAGDRGSNNAFLNFGSYASFWSATPYESDSDNAYYLEVYSRRADVRDFSVNYAYSVRCLKD